MRLHRRQRHAGINQVIHQQHAATQLALRHRDIFCNVQRTLYRTDCLTIRAGGQHRQRLIKNSAQHITRDQTAARQAQHHVKMPARLINLQRQAFNHAVITLPIDIQIGFGALLDAHFYFLFYRQTMD